MSGAAPSKPDFEALFEAAPGACLVLLPDPPRFTIVAVNDAYARATMTKREEILGRGLFEVFPDNLADPTAEGASNLRASFERVLSKRTPDAMRVQKFEIRRPAESGGEFEHRWWSQTNSPVFGPGGEITYLIHAIEEVTERDVTQARQAALAREQLLTQAKALFDQASDSIFIADLNGRFTDVNANACKMLGYSREELIGKTIADVIPPEDVPRLAATRQYLLSPGSIHMAEWTQLRKDGTPVVVEVSSKILPDGRWLAFVRDISERKRIEVALREAEEQFRLTIDEAPIGMALVALDGRFVRVNRALSELVGYSSAELTGLTFQAITHPDDLHQDLELAHRLARGDIPRCQFAKRYIRKDGTIVDVLLSVSVLRDRDGAPRFYITQIEDVSERKRPERELRDANAFLDAIIENVPLMLFVKESESLRFLRFNRAGHEMLGWTKESLIGKSDYDFWPREQADFFVEKDRETLKMGKVLDIAEEPIQTRDQGVRFLHTKKVPVLDAAGKPLYLLGISEDITERKRADAALRQSEAQFRGLIEHMPDGVFINQGGRVAYANHAVSTLLGYDSPTAMLGRDIDELFSADDRPIVAERIRAIQETGLAAPPRELGMVHRDGTLRCIESVELQAQFQGEPGIVVVIRDLTERRRLEQEQQFLIEAGLVLSASLDYEQTLASVARLVVQNIADWCVVEVMEESGRLWRLKVACADPGKQALRELLEQMPPDRSVPHYAQFVVDGKQAFVVEHVTRPYIESFTQGPEHLQLLLACDVRSLMATPLLSRGRPVGALIFASSAPSHSYGKSDLRLAEALADRAAVAIENARLYRTAVQATQLREQILGVVAHDLRNPLNTILMQASAGQRQGPEPERRSQKPKEVIFRAATRMNRLIQDLLDVARMEAGQLLIEGTRLGARELIIEAAETQRSLAATSAIEVRLVTANDLPEVWGDHDRLLQAFDNLIGNAMKFTKAGGQITVGADYREGEIIFSVADTGSGIPAENVSRVFDRFWQANRAARGGAGLGLAITKGIVEAHGGRIWVESKLGEGTTFFFSIPKAHPLDDRPSKMMQYH